MLVAGAAEAYVESPAMAPLSVASAAATWTFNPTATLIAAGVTIAYLAGVCRAPAWPWSRTLCFLVGGVGSLLLLTTSWVGVYAHRLFWVYTLQVTMLLVVTPMLLALGRPLTLARQVLPASSRFLDSSGFRLLSSPVIGPLLVPVTLGLVFFTAVLPVTARSSGALQILQAALVFLGFLFALPLAGENEHLGSFSLAVAMFIGSIELLADAVPGIVVRLRTHLLAPGVFNSLGDQQHGGAILWFLAEVIDLPFLGFLFVRWIRADRAEGARIDEELDAQAALASVDDEPWEKPWWEKEGDSASGRRLSR